MRFFANTSRWLGLAVLSCFAALLPWEKSAAAQEFTIRSATFDPAGKLSLLFRPDTNAYYTLFRGAVVTNISQPIDMILGTDARGELSDPTAVTNVLAFYLIRAVPLAHPLDTDGDGIDDVYELRHPGLLDPLNPLDAFADPDGDGLTTLQEYQRGTDPAVSEFIAPAVQPVTSPTSAAYVIVTGTAKPNVVIAINGGPSTITTVTGADATFSAQVPLIPNRPNRLFVSTADTNSQTSALQPIEVIQDSQPPSLFIDFPADGTVLTTTNTIIAGRVGDLLSGFMGLQVTVTNLTWAAAHPGQSGGGAANVAVGIGNNGSYERGGVPLAVGQNVIRVTASDVVGNSTNQQITLILAAPAGPRLTAVSGDAQLAHVHQRLSNPAIVRLTQADATTPMANQLVIFDVIRSDGRLLPVDTNQLGADYTTRPDANANGSLQLQLKTDANGQAQAWWTLGGDAGCGNNRIQVTSPGVSNSVYFCASAQPALAHQINIGSGNNQKAEVGGPAPELLRAWVNDSCNGVSNILVTFTVVQGNGLVSAPGQGLGPSSSVTVPTAATGHAAVNFQFGATAGQNVVEATFPGNPGLPATFVLYGVARDPAKATTLTGLVLDNTSQPIGNARCEIFVRPDTTNAVLTTYTDVQGRFAFTNAPSGPIDLSVFGNFATTLGGNPIPQNSFPFLSYTLTMIPNAENSLPRPVLLPRLNPNNAVQYDGTKDLVLTCEGIEGLKMTIKAGSMRDPRGNLVTPDNPATVSLNQVHHDQIPMPIPDGASPPFAWTLQPARSTFDPPIQVEYPNMSGLPAGTIAYFLSFNHDTERFEIVASGHVDNQGALIHSDPGAGLTISGWGCNCPPYSVTGGARNCCRIAVALFKGGPHSLDASTSGSSVGGALYDLANSLEQIDPRVFAQVFNSGDTADSQLTEAQQWLRDQAIEGCPGPVTVLIGHSLGGDTVALSASIEAQLRISIDPIDRGLALAFPFTCVFYQRNLTLTGLSDINYLAGDILDPEERERCGDESCTSVGCLRGYRIAGIPNPEFPGSDHSSIVSAASSQIVNRVRALLPDLRIARVQSDSSGARSFLDGSYVLSLGGQQTGVSGDGSFRIQNVSAPDQFGPGGPGTRPDFVGDDYVRMVGHASSGGSNHYVFSEFFQISQGQTYSVTNLTFTDIPPRKAESLSITPQTHVMTVLGQTNQLTVLARYADGTTNDVTARTTWTSYRISNPNVATVDPNGIITAKQAGTVFLTAVNEGASAVIQLDVSPGDQLTTISGRVIDETGSPVIGATVDLFDGGTTIATTGPDGRYEFTDIPTKLGTLSIVADSLENGVRVRGLVTSISPVVGGVTVLGDILLRPLSIARFSAGGASSIAIRQDGTLWGWGNNQYGQLGDGTITDRSAPVPVATTVTQTWKTVSTSYSHTMAITTDGTLWGWGDNSNGELGNGTRLNIRPSPVATATNLNKTWSSVSAGFSHTAAIAMDGTLWGWGLNERGQVGVGQTTNLQVLVPAAIATNLNKVWSQVACGELMSLALATDGTLWAWGSNEEWQFGNGGTGVSSASPVPAATTVKKNWVAIAVGETHCLAVADDGTLWAWGDNSDGELGDGSTLSRSSPVQVATNLAKFWVAVSAGYEISMALASDGTLWSWGGNASGSLGNGTSDNSLSYYSTRPTPAAADPGKFWGAISSGAVHTLALASDGTLWSWGQNSAGQLGDGGVWGRIQTTPVPIALHAKRTWTSASAGVTASSFALATDGTFWGWGDNYNGELGDGTQVSRLSPGLVATGPNKIWGAVSAGGGQTVASAVDGTLWGWGYNNDGQVGDGTITTRLSPVQILTTPAETWKTVAAGDVHTLALANDGSLWSWGQAFENGTGKTRLRPFLLATNLNKSWVTMSAGENHTLALASDGTLWSWGANGSGKLGDGSTVDRNSPVLVSTNLNKTWIAASAGYEHSLGIAWDGTLWAWGANYSGQLGDGTSISRMAPVPIAANLGKAWAQVSAGRGHSLALATDGSLWAWGANTVGQLGDGTTQNRLTPVAVGAGLNKVWTAISASIGYDFTLAVAADGSLWAWGYNQDGQIGLDQIRQVLGGAVWGP